MHLVKIIRNIIVLLPIGNTVWAQIKNADIKFSTPCFKTISKTNKTIKNDFISGYDCEFVFVPDVETYSSKTRNTYYRDWWNFFVAGRGSFIDIYPLKENDAKAQVRIDQLSDRNKVLYLGKMKTARRKDFDVKYDTDDWQIDTLSHLVKIIHNRTFKYNSELITIVNIEGLNLYVPEKCKTIEGYSLVYSNKRGFVGSNIYFFSKKNQNKAISYHFIGDEKLEQFMNKKHLIHYIGPGIWWECDR